MRTVVGVDGGGTKTAVAILAEDGRVLGRGEAGPSTFGVVPREITRASIQVAAAQAAHSAGLAETSFAAAFLGLGNVVSEKDRREVREMAAALGLAPIEQIGVDHDIRVALAGALSGRPGIVLIAGTGTSCYGVNAAGQSWRAGGWGPLIDDEGSSYWLGIQAMRAAILEVDGRGQPTFLTGLVAQALELGEMDELMNRLYAAGMTRTEIAGLAPLVFAAAAQGDQAAQALIEAGCAAMAGCVLTVARRLGMHQSAGELAVVGGLTHAGAALLDPLARAIAQRLPEFEIKQAELSPEVGAGLLAIQMLHQSGNRN